MAKTLRATDPKKATPSKPKILIFGKPGVGKTWASLDFPSVYYIDTEGGANLEHYTDKLKKSGGAYLGPDQGSNDFNVIIEEVQALATTQHRFRTLVIDSLSKLFGSQIAATAEALERAGKKNEFGADKKPAVGYMRRLIRWLDKLDMNVVLICHEKPVYIDGEIRGQTYDGWDKLEYELHLALHITKTGPSRRAKVMKSRLEQFPDAEVFDWSYAGFADRFGRDIIESDAKPVEMSTPEQIARYNELLAAVKVPEAALTKWQEACEDVSELDRDGLQKRIDYLTKLLPKAA